MELPADAQQHGRGFPHRPLISGRLGPITAAPPSKILQPCRKGTNYGGKAKEGLSQSHFRCRTKLLAATNRTGKAGGGFAWPPGLPAEQSQNRVDCVRPK